MMADLESREIADVAAKGEKIYARLKGALEPNFNGKYVIIDTNQVNFSLLERYPTIQDVMPNGLLYFRPVGPYMFDPIAMYCIKVTARKRLIK
ncbi:MAG TPA: hypothetical protein VI968_04100 [archaeon]|nr:hypothetical protein [archaeon]